jgi:hypothetical protein
LEGRSDSLIVSQGDGIASLPGISRALIEFRA